MWGLFLREALSVGDDSVQPISYPLLAALAIGAYRPYVVPKLFEEYIADETNEASIQNAFDQFKGVLMIVWLFVGIPWLVPACLGLVNALKSRGLELLAEGRKQYRSGRQSRRRGSSKEDIRRVQNGEVWDMLRTYFSDFSALTWTVVFGYSLAGTTNTGIFKEENTQLILAASITSSGATRQAKSHVKASLCLGNSVVAIAIEVREALAAAESQGPVALSKIQVRVLEKRETTKVDEV
ncbi:hypothetical protein G7Y89_g10316 [Cudoniella acicularis]|uniref:Uncharacterized protein n=1 Tax=Cudoniella acicularis TaxID=354080 RepID=A0A8H4RFB9_9HELO|nr:hypothetical protein G7Y89_g10316 [Cudoniella acicularis]